MPVKHVDDVPVEKVQAGTGASRQVLIGPNEAPHFAMRRFIIEAGGGMPAHTNTVEHEQYVLRGRAEISIGNRAFEVEAGSVVYIPSGAPHSYKVKSEEPFEFICVVPNLPDEMTIVA